MPTTASCNVITQQDLARARQARRPRARRKLAALIDLADAQFRARQFGEFEQTRLAIRIVLADLGSAARGTTARRVAERLPASPTRRGGAESEEP